MLDGITFDSRGEADLYRHLCFLRSGGLIKSFEMQVPFKLYAGIVYVADFVVTMPDDRRRTLDFKGVLTPEFKLKKKLFEADHGPLEIVTRETGWKQWLRRFPA